jgi:(1->4)-alpha-D-glucan 1-alpha-D-glucosylmutase
LDALAERCGIAIKYYDIWGKRQAVPDATLRALLVEMGALADRNEDPAQALEARRRGEWLRTLAPVQVVRASGAEVRVRIVLPMDAIDSTYGWQLVEEGGGVRSGEFAPAACQTAGEGGVNGVRYRAFGLRFDGPLPMGYHRFELRRGATMLAAMPLIAVPDQCYRPDAVRNGARIWGPAIQLYTLRSERNWGIGDFTDLRQLMEHWAGQGADIVGLNPLHAMFWGNPAHASPYSPSSRLFLNLLYLDVEAIADYGECEPARHLVGSHEFQQRLQAQRQRERVEYQEVAALKRSVLELLYGHFRECHIARHSERAQAFEGWRAERGESLRRYALFEALYEHFRQRDPNAWGWMQWPERYRDPQSAEVSDFARGRAERVEFFEYLQWQAHHQLTGLGWRSMELGLGVGLYLDLAVSVDRNGADTWCNRAVFATTASVGAPPDDFNLKGQDWGLPPFVPDQLRELAYAPFIEVLRENMREAGALRIDHVMGLMRLFWIPSGGTPAHGAYVGYPIDDLLGIVALESQGNRCMVIGEDLGTVPDEVRKAMRERGMLSYRPLLFEKKPNGDFKMPGEYDGDALVAVTTHDLPTLAGYWHEADLALRAELGLLGDDAARKAQAEERAEDRARLALALRREGLLPDGANVESAADPEMSEGLSCAIHAFLARTPSAVMVVQLEDVLGLREQVNLPGTDPARYPSWSRKIPLPVEAWPDHERFQRLTAAIRQVRPGTRPR